MFVNSLCWFGVSPFAVKYCGFPPVPPGAADPVCSLTGPENKYPTLCAFACRPGVIGTGGTMECNDDGTWSVVGSCGEFRRRCLFLSACFAV